MSWLDPGNYINQFLHPEDPWKKAEQAAEQGWNQAQGFEKPYWQHGLDQYGALSDAEKALMDPAALESKWASSYEESPYAKQMLEMNKNSGLDAASSMGLMGSSAALGNIQTGAGNIVNADRRNYLSDLMNKYMSGIGIGQNMYGIGADMGKTMGGQAMQQGANMAQLSYGRNAAKSKLLENIMRMVAQAMGASGGMGGGDAGMPAYAQNAIMNG